MSEVQRPHANRGVILLVIGALAVVSGLFLYSNRADLAEFFLGARFLFGIPVTNADSLKLLAVAVATSAVAFKGLLIAGVGIVLLAKNDGSAPQRPAATANQ